MYCLSLLGVSVEYLVTGEISQASETYDTYESVLFKKYRPLIKKLDQLLPNAKTGVELLIENYARNKNESMLAYFEGKM